MDNKLLAHEKFIKTEIEKIESGLKSIKNKQDATLIKVNILDLNNYHQKTVRDFQHERLIHLIVTFFFGGLLLFFIAAIFLFALLPMTSIYAILSTLILITCVFLFVTEVFYVRHYYQLENGTQRLYELSRKLYKLISHINTLHIDIQP